jgi:hypothetical protein
LYGNHLTTAELPLLGREETVNANLGLLSLRLLSAFRNRLLRFWRLGLRSFGSWILVVALGNGLSGCGDFLRLSRIAASALLVLEMIESVALLRDKLNST